MQRLKNYSFRFWLKHLALPLTLGLLFAFVYPKTSLDSYLISPFYDATITDFPLRKHWFFENMMHLGLKYLVIIVAIITLLVWLSSFFATHFKPHRRSSAWIFVALVLSTSIISLLKSQSIHACPWSLVDYGGTQPLITLFGELPIGAEAGHCFPGGHASGGFALMAFYFAWRDQHSRLAAIMLALGLIMGFMMGTSQMMRGAHFMSHTLWTGWIVWMILFLQYLLWQPFSNSSKHI